MIQRVQSLYLLGVFICSGLLFFTGIASVATSVHLYNFSIWGLIDVTNGMWGWFSIMEMFIFVGILVLGLAYAWVKGHLDWVRPEIQKPDYQSKIPASAYENVSRKYGK